MLKCHALQIYWIWKGVAKGVAAVDRNNDRTIFKIGKNHSISNFLRIYRMSCPCHPFWVPPFLYQLLTCQKKGRQKKSMSRQSEGSCGGCIWDWGRRNLTWLPIEMYKKQNWFYRYSKIVFFFIWFHITVTWPNFCRWDRHLLLMNVSPFASPFSDMSIVDTKRVALERGGRDSSFDIFEENLKLNDF